MAKKKNGKAMSAGDDSVSKVSVVTHTPLVLCSCPFGRLNPHTGFCVQHGQLSEVLHSDEADFPLSMKHLVGIIERTQAIKDADDDREVERAESAAAQVISDKQSMRDRLNRELGDVPAPPSASTPTE